MHLETPEKESQSTKIITYARLPQNFENLKSLFDVDIDGS